jgi:hypothetical protein
VAPLSPAPPAARCIPPVHAALKRTALRLRYRVRLLVETAAFNNLFLGAILANTVVLALEHDGMTSK